MRNFERRQGAGRWNGWRYMVAFPMLIGVLCAGGMLSEQGAMGAAQRVVRGIHSSLDMYFRAVGGSSTGGGATGSQTNDLAPSGPNSFAGVADSSTPPSQGHSTVSVTSDGFDVAASLARGNGAGDQSLGSFTVDFMWSDAVGYAFSGNLTSSTSATTPGSFLVMLENLDSGTTVFRHKDMVIAPSGDTIVDANSQGATVGEFLGGTNYRLTVSTEFDNPGSGGADPTVTASSHVVVSFSDVPEPATGLLAAIGAGALSLRRRRRVV